MSPRQSVRAFFIWYGGSVWNLLDNTMGLGHSRPRRHLDSVNYRVHKYRNK